MKIRNIAIIAHVDHGKTTLVDAMLKQTKTFRDNQKEMNQTLIMDSNELEKEKGITILAKNTSIFYKDIKINIIDTPGHADFAGEVERTLNMASGALLLVDASEGPLPQTKFVLKKALEFGLKIILVINKIDKKDQRAKEVLNEVEDLFLELVDNESALNFKTLFTVGRDGKAYEHLPQKYNPIPEDSLIPLFETIISEIPESNINEDKPFQMLISTLDYDNYLGRLCIGKISQGTIQNNNTVALIDNQKTSGTYKITKIYTSVGLQRQEVNIAHAGDIISLAGIPQLFIGQTLTDPSYPISLPTIKIEEPTIKVTVGPNTSPLAGKEGKFVSSAQIKDRLLKEKEINIGLRIIQEGQGANFTVCGRGELHLAILLETLRRESYELEVTKPQIIYKTINEEIYEPYEEVTIDVDSNFLGIITQELAQRKGILVKMHPLRNNGMRFVYKITSFNLLGIRNSLLTKTRGTAIINTYFLGFFPKTTKVNPQRNGALIATDYGKSLTFGLVNAQERGILFIGPGVDVYEGMVVGISARDKDIEVNVVKAKRQTNVRSETADITVPLTPPLILELEQALDFIREDEVLEITPENIRIRKKYLPTTLRKVMQRKERNLVQPEKAF